MKLFTTLSISMLSVIFTMAYAGTELWFSGNANQIISIKLEPHYTKAKVWIMPDPDPISKWKPTGINIKNCGDIIHVDPGMIAMCDLSLENPAIIFSADKSSPDVAAYGTYIYNNRG